MEMFVEEQREATHGILFQISRFQGTGEWDFGYVDVFEEKS